MQISFYIKDTRLPELKEFIRNNMPTARHKHNPLKIGNEYNVCLYMSVEDNNKLNELQNIWFEQDNPPPVSKKSKIPLWKHLFKKIF